jgi:DNA-binding winged helix-turn-helix (wHTH) protein
MRSMRDQRAVGALAVPRDAPYALRMRAGSRQLLWFASGAVVVCTALGVALFLSAYASLSREAFHDRTVTYARAFAVTADTWLARSQIDVVQTLAGVLAAGSVQWVEVMAPDGGTIATAGSRTASDTSPGVSVVETPLPTVGGAVRMGVSDSAAVLVVRHAAYFSIGGALLFDAAIVAILAWALRGRRRPVDLEPAPAGGADDPRIVIGDLEILPSRCEVAYAGEPLRLTPKQFALLCVLASHPGKVFTEAEILAAAWPDSSYADAKDIKQYVYLLRRRLAAIRPEGRDVIVTVPGFGYRLGDGH